MCSRLSLPSFLFEILSVFAFARFHFVFISCLHFIFMLRPRAHTCSIVYAFVFSLCVYECIAHFVVSVRVCTFFAFVCTGHLRLLELKYCLLVFILNCSLV